MPALPRLTNRDARRLFLHRHGLGTTPSGPGKGADLAQVIHDLGFVQLDSINTVARAHHMILHSRRTAYRAKHLDAMLNPGRHAFEHWTHDASMISMPFFAHWHHQMARHAAKISTRWAKDRRPGYEAKCDDILKQISDHGACCSSDVGQDEEKSSGGWWDWHPSKTALEYLWRKGELSVCHRRGFRKYYDLTERVIPPEHLNARTHIEDTVNWACTAALDRLGFATPTELANFWDLTTKAEAKTWVAQALKDQRIIAVELQGADKQWHLSYAAPDLLSQTTAPPPDMIRILSPFDPALRDRNRAHKLFGFHYRIEVFVPEAKRVYGYYVFPVLEGDRIIGRLDAKCDRKTDTLTIRAFWPEPNIRLTPPRLTKLTTALERTARLAGSTRLDFAPDWQRAPMSSHV